MSITDRRWLPQDTLNIQRLTGTDVSPDGRRLVFTASQAVMNAETNGFLTQIYLAEAGGDPPRQLTTGDTSSFAPKWSPDGQSVAFLSRSNIWLMSLPSGNTRQVTDVPTGVSSLKWSPDGSTIAFTAADDSESTEEQQGPRIVGQEGRNRRLYLVSLAELARGPARGRPVTGSDIHVGAPGVPEAYAWSPDCRTIVFAHCRSPQQNDWPTTRLARLNVADASVQPVGPDWAVTWDPHMAGFQGVRQPRLGVVVRCARVAPSRRSRTRPCGHLRPAPGPDRLVGGRDLSLLPGDLRHSTAPVRASG
jgi:Tol biopolymer transport system component